jgi:hypothetical protein
MDETAVDLQGNEVLLGSDGKIHVVGIVTFTLNGVFPFPGDAGNLAQRRFHLGFQGAGLSLAFAGSRADRKVTSALLGSRLKAQRRNLLAVTALALSGAGGIGRLQVADMPTRRTYVRDTLALAHRLILSRMKTAAYLTGDKRLLAGQCR